MSRSKRRGNDADGSGRWSARRKVQAVLRLLPDENLDALSRPLKVTAVTPSEWPEVFRTSGMAGLKTREVNGRDQ